MDPIKFSVQAYGHSLELQVQGEAFFCRTCDSGLCEKIAWFNKHYQVKLDPRSPKGWHVVESR